MQPWRRRNGLDQIADGEAGLMQRLSFIEGRVAQLADLEPGFDPHVAVGDSDLLPRGARTVVLERWSQMRSGVVPSWVVPAVGGFILCSLLTTLVLFTLNQWS